MTPFSLRASVAALIALLAATAINAIYLQDNQRGLRQDLAGQERRTVSPGAASPRDGSQQRVTEAGRARETATAPPATNVEDRSQTSRQQGRLDAAIQRELRRKGYNVSPPTRDGLTLAIIVYEFDSGLDLSGRPSDELLKRLVFDLKQAPKGLMADRAENDDTLVLPIQKLLLELGFFSGALSGRMDDWTSKAVRAFERHRGLAETGRLTETMLASLIAYSGQPITRQPRTP